MKIGRLEICFTLHPKPREIKPKTPYTGKICDICGIVLGTHTMKAEHFHLAHPKYSFHCEDGGSTALTYVCNTCNLTCGGVAGVFRHYQERHPQEVV